MVISTLNVTDSCPLWSQFLIPNRAGLWIILSRYTQGLDFHFRSGEFGWILIYFKVGMCPVGTDMTLLTTKFPQTKGKVKTLLVP